MALASAGQCVNGHALGPYLRETGLDDKTAEPVDVFMARCIEPGCGAGVAIDEFIPVRPG